MPEEEIRWHYRFHNFSRAFGRLQDALKGGAEALNELEQEGFVVPGSCSWVEITAG